MNKFKKRRDISTMVNMVGKLKNPADETMANLKSIEDMLASDESGYAIPPISSNISAYEPDQLKNSKKKDKSLTEEQKKTLEGAIETGDKKAIRKSGAAGKYKRAAKQDLKAKQKQDIDKASETLKFVGEVNRLNPESPTGIVTSMAKKKKKKKKKAPKNPQTTSGNKPRLTEQQFKNALQEEADYEARYYKIDEPEDGELER